MKFAVREKTGSRRKVEKNVNSPCGLGLAFVILCGLFSQPKYANGVDACQNDNDCSMYPGSICRNFQTFMNGEIYAEGKRCALKCKDVVREVILHSGYVGSGDARSIFDSAGLNNFYTYNLETGAREDSYAFYSYVPGVFDALSPAGYVSASGILVLDFCNIEFWNKWIPSKHCYGWVQYMPYYWGGEGSNAHSTSETARYLQVRYHCLSCPSGYIPRFRSVHYSFSVEHVQYDSILGNDLPNDGWNDHCSKIGGFERSSPDDANYPGRDDWVSCGCMRQTDSEYCSMGCKIPHDMGCYKTYSSNVTREGATTCPSVTVTGDFHDFCSTGITNNFAGCWLSRGSQASTVYQMNIPELGGCWIRTDSSVVNSNGVCRPSQGNTEYCDETGCFNIGETTCDSDWMNMTTEN